MHRIFIEHGNAGLQPARVGMADELSHAMTRELQRELALMLLFREMVKVKALHLDGRRACLLRRVTPRWEVPLRRRPAARFGNDDGHLAPAVSSSRVRLCSNSSGPRIRSASLCDPPTADASRLQKSAPGDSSGPTKTVSICPLKGRAASRTSCSSWDGSPSVTMMMRRPTAASGPATRSASSMLVLPPGGGSCPVGHRYATSANAASATWPGYLAWSRVTMSSSS